MASNTVTPGQPQPMRDGEFASQSRSARTSWSFDKLEPPSPLYVTRDDVLVIQAASITGADVVHVSARILTIDGVIVPLQRDFVPSTSFPSAAQSMPLVEGFLLSVTALGTLSTDRGMTFVRAWLNRGVASIGNAVCLLLADYITAVYPTSWPYGALHGPTEGTGRIFVEQFGAVSAGQDWSFAAPTGRRWRVRSVFAQLVTNATVATRQVVLRVTDSTIAVWESAPSANIPASTTARVSAGPSQVTSTVMPTQINVTLPGDLIISGSRQGAVQVVTTNLQAGDQWSSVVLYTEEWFENI